jgi:hypothetical protein
VNAFLTLAATRHTFVTDDLRSNSKVNDIVTAAKAGRVPVHLVSSAFKLHFFYLIKCLKVLLFDLDLSEKNKIEILSYDATLVSLLGVFARGSHRSMSTPRLLLSIER